MKFKFTEFHKMRRPQTVNAEDNSVFLFYENEISTEMKFNVEDFRDNIILLSNNFVTVMGVEDSYIGIHFDHLYPTYQLEKVEYPIKWDMYSYSKDFCCYEIFKRKL